MDGTLPQGQRANMAQCWTVIQTHHWQESGHVWDATRGLSAVKSSSQGDSVGQRFRCAGDVNGSQWTVVGCIRRGFDAACDLPEETSQASELGMTALQKPDGGVRGIVVGDVVRRLVARTLAQ